jgi:electron transport complex protein RnfD
MILAIALLSTIFNGINSSHYASPLFHVVAGATLFGAFFIATDPVTGATTPLGKILYGAGIGILVYVIRTWGGYPDSVAFAVLLMNITAPLIDKYTKPRVFGHERKRRS